MHPHDVKRLSRKTERELRVVWIRAHVRVPIANVGAMKLPQLSPKQFFKLRFIDPDGPAKDCDKRRIAIFPIELALVFVKLDEVMAKPGS